MAPPPINAKAETSLRCPYCRRDDCYVPVTDDWPAWAREAYERGGYEEALAADVQGDITFAVNAVYLRQIARSVSGRMILRLSGPFGPMRIEPVDGDSVVFVAVPLRAEHSIPRPV